MAGLDPSSDNDDSDRGYGEDNFSSPASFVLAQQRRANVGAINDLEANPEDAVKAQQLARATGAGPALVYGNLENFEQQHKAALTSEILNNNPYIRDFIQTHPLGSKIINDDYGQLDKFSQLLQATPVGKLGASLKDLAKDFGEGFGTQGLMFQPTPAEAAAHPGMGALAAVADIATAPLQVGFRLPGGVINAVAQSVRRSYETLTGKSGEDATEAFLQAVGDPAMVATLGPLGELLGGGLHERALRRAEIEKVAPYVKAGEVPPPGVSPIIDQARQDENKEFLKSLKEQGAEANATNLIERDPESFKAFVNQHAPEHIELQADAVRALLGEEEAKPGDGKFGDIPGFNEELALAERHNGHVQVPLADWFLFANKNPEEAKFLEKFAAMPGGVTEAEGELAKEREAAKPKEEEAQPYSLEKTEPSGGMDFFDIKDEKGTKAGEAHITFDKFDHTAGGVPTRATIEDVFTNDFIPTPKDEAGMQAAYESSRNAFGPQRMRELLRDLQAQYPNLTEVRGRRISGARYEGGAAADPERGGKYVSLALKSTDPHALAMDSVKAASSFGAPMFAHEAGIIPPGAESTTLTAGDKVYPIKHFMASDALKMVDKDQLTGVPRALAEFYHDRLDRAAGQTPIAVVDSQTMRTMNKRFGLKLNTPAFYSPDDKAILMRNDIASGRAGHGVATHILVHEIDHAASFEAIEKFPDIKKTIRATMDETDRWMKQYFPEARKEHDYAFTNEHEFAAEARSKPAFQELLAGAPVSEELAKRLDLRTKSPTMWDAVRQIVSKLVEKWLGIKPPPTVLDAMFKVHEAIEEANKALGEERVKADEGALGAEEREPELPGITRMESRSAFRTPGAVGLKADALRKYMGLIEKQQEVEQKHIESKALEDERQRQTSEWKENEKRVRSEVREGINRRPDIAADRYLRDGILEGKKAGDFKLDKGALTDEQLGSLDPGYYRGGGVNPDDMARLFGFQSGDALVQALGQLKEQRDLEGLTPQAHISKLVSIATEHEMQRQYGDLEENILREAKEHVFSPSQIDILADETVHLAELAKSELPITKEDLLKGARQVFDASPLRAIDSKAFEASAGRAGQAVQDALLKGDYRAALKAKQEQTNAAIYANLALKFEKELKRFNDVDAPRWGRREPPGTRQEDAVWMHQILLQVKGPDGIQTSRQDLERRKAMSSKYNNLREYVEAKNKAHGTASTDPNNPPITRTLNVTDSLFSENWPGKDFDGLSVAEFKEINNSLKSINHYSHEENTYDVKGNKEDLAKVLDGLVERLKAAVDNKPAVTEGHQETLRRNVGTWMLNTETWMNRLDLGNRQGPFNQLIMRPIVEGQNYLRDLERQFAQKWKDLGPFPDFNKKLTNTIFRAGDGSFRPMTKGNAYAVLQNMGNALQRRKLIEGWNISKDQDAGEQMVWSWLKNIAGMGPEDLARAQKMGKVFSDAFSLAEKAYNHTAGVAPARIELYKVRTPWGDADEWYHPLIKDPLEGTGKIDIDQMMGDSGYWKPSPASGYTKTRTGARYPLDFSFESAAFKLKQILNDAAMRIPITEVSKIVYNEKFQQAFKKYYGPEYHSALDAWMKDAAGNRQWQPANMKALEKIANNVADNMSTMMIGFNLHTVGIHGLTAAMFSGTEVGLKGWTSSIKNMIQELPGSRERWNFAMDSSEELRNRLRNMQDTIIAQHKELFKTQQNRAFDSTRVKLENFRDLVHYWGHAPVGAADLLSAVTMWDAEYRRLGDKDPDMTHGDLVYGADTAVRRTHGSSILTNRASIQRVQNPFVRALIPFYNFLSNDLQRIYELAWKAKLAVQGRELPEMTGFLKEKFEAGPQHILPLMGGLAVFAIIPGLIHHMISGQPKKSDESEGAHLAKAALGGLAAPIPGVRDFAGYMTEGYDPSLGLYGTLARDVSQALTLKNWDYRTNPGKAFRTATDTLALTTGLSTVSADKVGEYYINVIAGKEHPKGFGDLWSGMMRGTQQPPRSQR